jgi:hypothetical protein
MGHGRRGGAPSAKLCIWISLAVTASSVVVFFREPRDLMPREYDGLRGDEFYPSELDKIVVEVLFGRFDSSSKEELRSG